MSITVKQLGDKFKYLKDADFKYLTGKSPEDIKDNDTVSLSRLAKYNKRDIQIFAAKKEKQNFLGLLQGKNQTVISKEAGITTKESKNTTNPFAQKDEHQRSTALGAWIPPERKAWIG